MGNLMITGPLGIRNQHFSVVMQVLKTVCLIVKKFGSLKHYKNKCNVMLDPQTGNVFVLKSSVGVQRRNTFIRVQ